MPNVTFAPTSKSEVVGIPTLLHYQRDELLDRPPPIPPRSARRPALKPLINSIPEDTDAANDLQVGVYAPQLGFLPRSGDDLSSGPAAGSGTEIHCDHSPHVDSGQILPRAIRKKSKVQVGDDRTGPLWTPQLASGPNTGATSADERRKSKIGRAHV